MAARHLHLVLRHLRRLAGTTGGSGVTDGQLLERFITHHDEAAFELLVRRHERMVWGVCRRLLANPHDAEDAFQATFVVLVRKAASVARRESVACWLHQVAYRVALRARANMARIATNEQLGMDLTSTADPHDCQSEQVWRDLRPLLDQEINRLPEKYRAPVVMCYLEGKSYGEAAQHLGCPKGTVSIRLTRARELLRVRLARRGLALSVGVLAGGLSQEASTASIPVGLVASAVRCATVLSVERAAVDSSVPTQVATLADGLLHAMFLSQAKVALAGLLAVALVAASAGLLAHHATATKEQSKGQLEQPSLAAPKAVQPERKEERFATDFYGDPLPAGALSRIGTLRLWQGSQFYDLAYTPDGHTLAACGTDDTIWLWDPATGKQRRRLPTGWVNHLAISPDSSTLAAATFDSGAIQIWDLATGKEIRQLPGDEKGRKALAFSPDGRILATALDVIHLWDVATWRELGQLVGHSKRISSIAFLDRGRTLVSGSEDKTLRWWDVATRREIRRIHEGLAEITKIAASPDGKQLATAESLQTLRFWEAATGKERSRLIVGGDALWSLSFSPDGRTLASGGLDGKVRFFDTTTGQESRHWVVEDHVTNLAFSPDGKVLAQAGGGMIRLRNAVTGEPAIQVPRLPHYVTTVLFGDGGRTLITGCWGGSVGFWDARSGKALGPIRPAPDGYVRRKRVVTPIALAAQGKVAAAETDGGTVYVWDPATGKERCRITTPPAFDEIFSPDGTLLAAQHSDKTVRLWETATGKMVQSIQALDELTCPRTFSPDGKVLATASLGDKQIRLWDVATGKQRGHFASDNDTGPVGLAYLPGGKLLASSYLLTGERRMRERQQDCPLRLWDVTTGKEIRQFHRPGDRGWALAVSPDGKTLAAGSYYGTIQLWEIASARERGRFQGHLGEVSALAFSPDGILLASGSYDYTALVWDLTGMLREGELPAVRLRPAQLPTLWTDLASADAARAYRAMWKLAACHDSVPFIAQHLHPTPAVGEEKVARLVANLDSARFDTRAKATAELEKLGGQAEPLLRRALTGNASLEVRQRVESLLCKLQAPVTSPEALRHFRAVESLEHAGTPDARRLLRSLAKGASDARLTHEAKAALERMVEQPAAVP